MYATIARKFDEYYTVTIHGKITVFEISFHGIENALKYCERIGATITHIQL